MLPAGRALGEAGGHVEAERILSANDASVGGAAVADVDRPHGQGSMIFTATELPGSYIIEIERHTDVRGFFARTWCRREFEAHGLNPRLVQCSISVSHRRGTLRGMHYQAAPNEEAKLVRCCRGAIYDVVIDLRPQSRTFKQHITATLTADNYRMVYVPEGCAHGFQTLEDNSEVVYQMSEYYAPASASGVRWDDPAFGIEWPIEEPVILGRDRTYPDFDQ